MSDPARRWRQLALLATAELLGMSVWFAGTAVAPALRSRLLLSGSEAAWLTSAVQLGFVAGTLIAAVLNLSDVWPLRWYVAGSAALAAAANAWLIPAASLPVALASRALTGMALAGVYPPAMKMAATWFKAERGLAIGAIVGALTVGKALPYLLEGSGALPFRAVVAAPSVAALCAGLMIALWFREGPYPFPARPFSWGLVGSVVREPVLRQVTGGYLGHMWELYAYWAWVPTFLAASFAARHAGAAVGIVPFFCVAIGGAGALWGGRAADRIGRIRVVRASLYLSGACCVLSAGAFGGPAWLVVSLCLVWGIAVIADSAQFSALVTEHAPPHAVGTALTLQTSLGFLLTAASIQLVPAVAAATGWRWAMVILTLGPVAALWSVRRMGATARTSRSSPRT
jgi:MFS family permease